MKILYTDEFKREFKRLPEKVQRMYLKQERIFVIHRHDPRLHIKKLAGDPITFSFRITRNYRALFFFDGIERAIMATIGHRKDVYRNK